MRVTQRKLVRDRRGRSLAYQYILSDGTSHIGNENLAKHAGLTRQAIAWRIRQWGWQSDYLLAKTLPASKRRRTQRVVKNCATCGKQFKSLPKELRKYCSSACAHKRDRSEEIGNEEWHALSDKPRADRLRELSFIEVLDAEDEYHQDMARWVRDYI